MSRVPRGTLNRERIVAAALEVIDREGVEGLSMPKLARQLGVGVMSLYSHVANKDDLLDAAAQQVLASLPEPSGRGWRERIRSHFGSLRAALLAHPGLGHVLANKNVATPIVLDLLERNLTELTRAGLEDEDAVRLYYALLAYTLGFVAWELPRAHAADPAEYARRWRLAIATTSPDTHPTLHRLEESLASVATDDQYHDGIDRLLSSARPRRS